MEFKAAPGAYSDNALRVVAKLHQQGFVAYFAGGCVRDFLLQRECKDIDIATNATPQQVMSLFKYADGIGASFGVVLVREQGFCYEVATFRSDGDYTDARRPDTVHFCDAQNDALRRDFTINALFADVSDGRILDFVGGVQDLQARRIRCVGEAGRRFGEDALRMMRAVRFACQLGFELDEDLLQALHANAALLAKISSERIAQELGKILCSGRARMGIELLVDSGLMQHIIPEMYALRGCRQPPQYHPEGDVYVHTMMMLERLQPGCELSLALGVLLHDIGKPATFREQSCGKISFHGHDKVGAEMSRVILRRLKFANYLLDGAVNLVARHMQFMHVKKMRNSTLRRFMAAENFMQELELHRLDCLCSNGLLDNYEFLQQRVAELQNCLQLPEPILKGRDLVQLGMSPGPLFKTILDKIQELNLEGKILTKQQALVYVKRNYAKAIGRAGDM